jgi:hypothetical protein
VVFAAAVSGMLEAMGGNATARAATVRIISCAKRSGKRRAT